MKMRMLLRLATVLITLSPCVIICRCLPFEWHTFKRFFLFSKRLDERWLCTIKPIVRYACDHENIRNLQVNNNMKRTSLHNINTEAHKYRRAHTHTHTHGNTNASSRLHINRSDMWSLFGYSRGLFVWNDVWKREKFDFYFVFFTLSV